MGGPRSASMFSMCGMPCRSSVRAAVPSSHDGCDTPSHTRRTEGSSGTVKPLRVLFSRFAETGTSTVSTSVSNPAARARATSASILSGSPGR